MRFLFYPVLILVSAVVAAATFIYVALPAGFARDQVVDAVRARTGRDLHVAGPITVAFYPRASVILNDVSLSLPDVMSGEPFVKMERLELEMPLLPLFRREVRIEHFVLVRPKINLLVDRQGRRSWDFAAPASAEVAAKPAETGLRGSVRETGKTAAAEASVSEAPIPTAAGLEEVSLGDMRIEDGVVEYFDELSGTRRRIENIDARLGMDGIRKPMRAAGSIDWNNAPLPFELEVGSPKDIIENRPSPLIAKVTLPTGEARFTGTAKIADAIALEGAIQARSSALDDLTIWLGKPVPRVSAIRAASVKGRMTFKDRKIGLDQAEIVLDGTRAKGMLAIDFAGHKPLLRADLVADSLDLTPYLPARTAGPSPAAPAPADDSLDGLLARVNAEVGGSGASAKTEARVGGEVLEADGGAWSAAPIDLKGLSALNADVKIAFASLRAHDLATGQGKLTLTLKERLLKSKLMDVAVFGGKAGVALTLDARQKQPRLEGNLVLRRVDVGEALKVGAGIDGLDGQGEIALSGMSSGSSPRQLVAGLMGQGRIDMGEGALIGIDVGRMFDELQRGNLMGWRRDPEARTRFESLSASFTITKGRVQSDDLRVTGRRLAMTGAGTVDLPSRSLDYGVQPILYGEAPADATARGIEIPLRVSGPWSAPTFTPDLGRIARNVLLDPATAIGAAEQVLSTVPSGGTLKSAIETLTSGTKAGDLATIVSGALGGAETEAAPTTAPADPAAPLAADGQPSLIQQLINQQKQQSVLAPQP